MRSDPLDQFLHRETNLLQVRIRLTPKEYRVYPDLGGEDLGTPSVEDPRAKQGSTPQRQGQGQIQGQARSRQNQ